MGTIIISAIPDEELAEDGICSVDRFVPKKLGIDHFFTAVEEVLIARSPLRTVASDSALQALLSKSSAGIDIELPPPITVGPLTTDRHANGSSSRRGYWG